MRGASSAAFEDAYELAPLLGEDDNASTQSSEVDAPLGSDDDHVEPPGFGLISLFALFSEKWLWRWAVLTAGSISSVIATGLMINCLVRLNPWKYSLRELGTDFAC